MKKIHSRFQFFLATIFLLTVQLALAQSQKTISGTVTDTDGAVLPGVNITVEGAAQGTSTDFDGAFEIEANEGDVLLFTIVGFKDQKQEVSKSNTIDVIMEEGSELDEVLVTAFGREMTRNESTSSVTTVSAEEIIKSPFKGAQEALQGKAPGLTVNNTSGLAGSSPEIRIRGMNSITAGNSPLYVIDGVPVNSGNVGGGGEATSVDLLALVNSNDIENISVLKDASAVAPYGAQGSNGVILITTKSGKEGKTKFNLNYNLGIENVARDDFKVMNYEQYYDALKTGMLNGYTNGTEMSDDEFEDYVLNERGFTQIDHWRETGSPNTDWYDVLQNKNAITHNLDFSLSKGTEESSLYASVGYNKSEGPVIESGFKRISGNVKYDSKLSEAFDLSISAMVSNVETDPLWEEDSWFQNPTFARYIIPPFQTPYLEDGSLNGTDEFNTYGGGIYNPVYIRKNDILENNITRGIQNTNLDWEITDDLTFS